MEERYWELLEEVDRAFDKWIATQDKADYDNYTFANMAFQGFCTDVLIQLMENNSDILERLKEM